jgi:hypothetical protein
LQRRLKAGETLTDGSRRSASSCAEAPTMAPLLAPRATSGQC